MLSHLHLVFQILILNIFLFNIEAVLSQKQSFVSVITISTQGSPLLDIGLLQKRRNLIQSSRLTGRLTNAIEMLYILRERRCPYSFMKVLLLKTF